MPTLNSALLERTMQYIENDPACWDQQTLGVTTKDGQTIADFPGWAVMIHDPRQQPPRGARDEFGAWVPNVPWMVHGVWAPAYAARLLGLDAARREVFFRSRWGLDALRAGVDALVASAGAVEPGELQATMRDADEPRRR